MTEYEHLRACHPWLQDRVARVLAAWRKGAASTGEGIRVTESVRTLEAQQTYFAKGASRADGVHAYSLHQFSPALAVDCIVFEGKHVPPSVSDEKWQRYALAAEAERLEWGGRWKTLIDGPHIQIPLNQRVTLLQEALSRKGFACTPDGDLGPKTLAAIQAAETAFSIPTRAKTGWDRVSLLLWSKLHLP